MLYWPGQGMQDIQILLLYCSMQSTRNPCSLTVQTRLFHTRQDYTIHIHWGCIGFSSVSEIYLPMG